MLSPFSLWASTGLALRMKRAARAVASVAASCTVSGAPCGILPPSGQRPQGAGKLSGLDDSPALAQHPAAATMGGVYGLWAAFR